MATIYVIEYRVNEQWVGIRTNFYDTIKNAAVPRRVADKLIRKDYEILYGLDEGDRGSAMTTILNSLSISFPKVISIADYKSAVLMSVPAYKRNRILLDQLTFGTGTNELIGMPPEFDVEKMRFVWWDGDYARTPADQRLHAPTCQPLI